MYVSQWEAPVPEEMFQILLTNENQGKNYQVHAANIIKPT
jgi:hypothetical protein